MQLLVTSRGWSSREQEEGWLTSDEMCDELKALFECNRKSNHPVIAEIFSCYDKLPAETQGIIISPETHPRTLQSADTDPAENAAPPLLPQQSSDALLQSPDLTDPGYNFFNRASLVQSFDWTTGPIGAPNHRATPWRAMRYSSGSVTPSQSWPEQKTPLAAASCMPRKRRDGTMS